MTSPEADQAVVAAPDAQQRLLPFQDTSVECAICLEPLYRGEEEKHDSSSAPSTENDDGPVITLKCGHKWHYDCLVQQLQTARPSATKRLLFTGCQCAKCGTICEHARLENLTRTTDRLRAQVDEMLREQVALDDPDLWQQAQKSTKPSVTVAQVLDDARRKYAFFLCSHCEKPFFGGTVECADGILGTDNSDNSSTTTTTTPRLCVACAPQSQMACQNPLEHRGHLVWKCRYCCQPATHLCYGNVHFCNICHNRNSRRVRQQIQHGVGGGSGGDASRQPQPPALEPIPCSGTSCPFPKPNGVTHHTNDGSIEAEQVYGCAWCQSSVDVVEHALHTVEPGSHNLLLNPSGADGLRHWQQLNHRMTWQVETSELPVNETTTTNFVSSFYPCVMRQTIDLRQHWRVVANEQEEAAVVPLNIEVSARFKARTDCPSEFAMKAMLHDVPPPSDASSRIPTRLPPPVQELSTAVLTPPPDFWERTRLVLDNVSMQRTPFVTVVVMGKDSRFWQGLFGSKVADIHVRILGTPQELRPWLRTGPITTTTILQQNTDDHRNHSQSLEDASTQQTGHDRGRGLGPRLQRGFHGDPRQRPSGVLVLLREGLLPVLFFAAVLWLLRG